MIDYRLIKPAAALVMTGAAVAALTVGQTAFAASRAPASRPATGRLTVDRHVADRAAACTAPDVPNYTTPASVTGAGLKPGAPVGIWRYSEGGQASLWAAQHRQLLTAGTC